MTANKEDEDTVPDWNQATWEGATREQLRRWSRLSLEEIVAAQEEMAELTLQLSPAPGKKPPDE